MQEAKEMLMQVVPTGDEAGMLQQCQWGQIDCFPLGFTLASTEASLAVVDPHKQDDRQLPTPSPKVEEFQEREEDSPWEKDPREENKDKERVSYGEARASRIFGPPLLECHSLQNIEEYLGLRN